MIATLTIIVLVLILWAFNKAYDWHFDRKYGPHVVEFYKGGFGVRRRWVGGGFEFLGLWFSDKSDWWYNSASHERVYHFATKEEAEECIITYKADEARREAERKKPGGRRV